MYFFFYNNLNRPWIESSRRVSWEELKRSPCTMYWFRGLFFSICSISSRIKYQVREFMIYFLSLKKNEYFSHKHMICYLNPPNGAHGVDKKGFHRFFYVSMIIWRSWKHSYSPAVTHNKRNPIQNFFETACKRGKGMIVPPPDRTNVTIEAWISAPWKHTSMSKGRSTK